MYPANPSAKGADVLTLGVLMIPLTAGRAAIVLRFRASLGLSQNTMAPIVSLLAISINSVGPKCIIVPQSCALCKSIFLFGSFEFMKSYSTVSSWNMYGGRLEDTTSSKVSTYDAGNDMTRSLLICPAIK